MWVQGKRVVHGGSHALVFQRSLFAPEWTPKATRFILRVTSLVPDVTKTLTFSSQSWRTRQMPCLRVAREI